MKYNNIAILRDVIIRREGEIPISKYSFAYSDFLTR
jgi:hypothetical protein